MTIRPKNLDELDRMREAGRILNAVHKATYEFVTIGKALIEIDDFIAKEIKSHGATASFLHYKGYPASSCLSLNAAVVHGIPLDYELKSGDVLGVDIGVCFEGYHCDAAVTKALGSVSQEVRTLLHVTQQALQIGIEAAVAGNGVADIGEAVQDYIESQGKYGIVRELSGHGIGRKLQEEPEVLNVRNSSQVMLHNNMTLAIEPMVTLGDWRVALEDDNWTVVTRDGSIAAHFETTVIIHDNDPEILVPFPLEVTI